jgi:hypothetical protein
MPAQEQHWAITLFRPRRRLAVTATYLALTTAGTLVGLASVWRTPFYWAGLALPAALAAGHLAWLRGYAHQVALVGDTIEGRRFGRPALRIPLDRLAGIRLSRGHYTQQVSTGPMPTGFAVVRLTRDDGRVIRLCHPKLAEQVAAQVVAARPDLQVELGQDVDVRADPKVLEAGHGAVPIRRGNAGTGAPALLALALVADTGTVGWLGVTAGPPERPAVAAGPTEAALRRLAEPLPAEAVPVTGSPRRALHRAAHRPSPALGRRQRQPPGQGVRRPRRPDRTGPGG